MGISPKETFVRVRATLQLRWVWDLVMPDGHVVSTSRFFSDRHSCEEDAKQQGYPVIGSRRTVRKKPEPVVARTVISSNGSGVWTWKRFDENGELAARSSAGFLTKTECEQDAEGQS